MVFHQHKIFMRTPFPCVAQKHNTDLIVLLTAAQRLNGGVSHNVDALDDFDNFIDWNVDDDVIDNYLADYQQRQNNVQVFHGYRCKRCKSILKLLLHGTHFSKIGFKLSLLINPIRIIIF